MKKWLELQGGYFLARQRIPFESIFKRQAIYFTDAWHNGIRKRFRGCNQAAIGFEVKEKYVQLSSNIN